MSLTKKISDKLAILRRDPMGFMRVMKNVTKARLGLVPKAPKEGSRFSTDVEAQALKKYAAGAALGIVEIGVLDGLTTKEMAQVAHVPIYGIDPIIPDSMNERLIGHEEKIKQNLAFYKDFHFIKDFSYNAVKGWQQPFDFIFIDGDHRYEAVKQDLEDWLPLLTSSGFVSFHDSAPVTSIADAFEGWPGPIRLVMELKGDNRLEFVGSFDSLSVFRKK